MGPIRLRDVEPPGTDDPFNCDGSMGSPSRPMDPSDPSTRPPAPILGTELLRGHSYDMPKSCARFAFGLHYLRHSSATPFWGKFASAATQTPCRDHAAPGAHIGHRVAQGACLRQTKELCAFWLPERCRKFHRTTPRQHRFWASFCKAVAPPFAATKGATNLLRGPIVARWWGLISLGPRLSRQVRRPPQVPPRRPPLQLHLLASFHKLR